MAKVLTFIIPVRHQQNARDWQKLKANLAATVRSVASQTHPEWRAIIVANHGAELPELPENVDVKRVDFPPNQLHELGSADKELVYQAIRFDKGRRILAGMLHAGPMQHVMIVDDDDFVSNRLARFVAQNADANGWYVREGFVWAEQSAYLYRNSDFSKLCGSSHIIRADLYKLPATLELAQDEYIRAMLGSHIFIEDHLRSSGTALQALPFVGAVYRVAHAESHSRSKSVLAQYFLEPGLWKRPRELCRRLLRLTRRTRSIRQEFFGEP
jgi:hypothetical protein